MVFMTYGIKNQLIDKVKLIENVSGKILNFLIFLSLGAIELV
ncbi:hypothetical protein RBH29_15840 [Herbivorax sp. ANBcel31]|nr:hypothetical protein [Herbivorax sp. ANBcel31]MDQ2087902.1 hypothetical protein [Herbivorax sp. ANBcel31]